MLFSSWWTSRRWQVWIAGCITYFNALWTLAAFSWVSQRLVSIPGCPTSPHLMGSAAEGGVCTPCDRMCITPILWADTTDVSFAAFCICGRFGRLCSARGCAAPQQHRASGCSGSSEQNLWDSSEQNLWDRAQNRTPQNIPSGGGIRRHKGTVPCPRYSGPSLVCDEQRGILLRERAVV